MHLHHGWAILWLFLLGAIFGTALDAFHVFQLLVADWKRLAKFVIVACDSHYGYARGNDPGGSRSILISSTRYARRSLLAPIHVCLRFPGCWRPGTVTYV